MVEWSRPASRTHGRPRDDGTEAEAPGLCRAWTRRLRKKLRKWLEPGGRCRGTKCSDRATAAATAAAQTFLDSLLGRDVVVSRELSRGPVVLGVRLG